MRAVVVYESMFGNTAQVAEAITDGMRREGAEVSVLPVATASRDTAAGVDVVVVGAPTHGFSLSTVASRRNAVRDGATLDPADQGVREWLLSQPKLDGAVVAVFDTRMWSMRHWPFSAARRIARLLRRRGVRATTATAGFYVRGSKGPLVAGETDRARAWGAQLAGEVRHAA